MKSNQSILILSSAPNNFIDAGCQPTENCNWHFIRAPLSHNLFLVTFQSSLDEVLHFAMHSHTPFSEIRILHLLWELFALTMCISERAHIISDIPLTKKYKLHRKMLAKGALVSCSALQFFLKAKEWCCNCSGFAAQLHRVVCEHRWRINEYQLRTCILTHTCLLFALALYENEPAFVTQLCN